MKVSREYEVRLVWFTNEGPHASRMEFGGVRVLFVLIKLVSEGKSPTIPS